MAGFACLPRDLDLASDLDRDLSLVVALPLDLDRPRSVGPSAKLLLLLFLLFECLFLAKPFLVLDYIWFLGHECLGNFPFVLPIGAARFCSDVRAAAVEALGVFRSALRRYVFTAASKAVPVRCTSRCYVAVSAAMVALSRTGAFGEHAPAELEEGDLSREVLARESE